MAEAGMTRELLSVAIYEPLPGREQDSLETMAVLLKTLSAAGFSRDFLYKDNPSTCCCATGSRKRPAGRRMRILGCSAVGRNWGTKFVSSKFLKCWKRLICPEPQ